MVVNGSLVGVLTGHAGPVTTVDAVPSGDVAFSGGGDGLVRSWDLSTCRAIDVRAVAADISAVRSYGQDRLIVGTRDGRIIVIEQQIGHFGTSDQLADGLSCVNSLDVDDR